MALIAFFGYIVVLTLLDRVLPFQVTARSLQGGLFFALFGPPAGTIVVLLLVGLTGTDYPLASLMVVFCHLAGGLPAAITGALVGPLTDRTSLWIFCLVSCFVAVMSTAVYVGLMDGLTHLHGYFFSMWCAPAFFGGLVAAFAFAKTLRWVQKRAEAPGQ